MTGLRELAAAFGTPLYVYDLAEARRCAEELRSDLPAGAKLFYSVKANPHPEVAETLRLSGCGAEISSLGELEVALAAGFPAEDLMYTGPAKTASEILAAARAGVRSFSTESPIDFRRIAAGAEQAGIEAEVLLRVAGTARGASGLRMTGGASQFGHPIDALTADPGAFQDIKGASLTGLHHFSVSNVSDESALIDELTSAVRLSAELRDRLGLQLRSLDLGGGFAAPYAIGTAPPAYPRLKTELEQALDECLPAWRRGDPSIAFESGRRLTATCGTLVAEVMDVKLSQGARYVVLDTGINHLGGLSGTGRMMRPKVELTVLGRPDPAASGLRAVVTGPLCTPADVLSFDAAVPDVVPGDLVAIRNVGAYGLSASLTGFLSRPMPIEVPVDSSGAVRAGRLRLRREPVAMRYEPREGQHDDVY
ncbi:hypothetical protein OG474_45490 [Kribbella sp. NBC_01505]|uniref:type III PLP-dependent enzyme n=1 Tax=Kribbella sp. NBC_01505 TaxID=2903580 RepID=UPI00386597CA